MESHRHIVPENARVKGSSPINGVVRWRYSTSLRSSLDPDFGATPRSIFIRRVLPMASTPNPARHPPERGDRDLRSARRTPLFRKKAFASRVSRLLISFWCKSPRFIAIRRVPPARIPTPGSPLRMSYPLVSSQTEGVSLRGKLRSGPHWNGRFVPRKSEMNRLKGVFAAEIVAPSDARDYPCGSMKTTQSYPTYRQR